jgi:hypothetical protein
VNRGYILFIIEGPRKELHKIIPEIWKGRDSEEHFSMKEHCIWGTYGK